MSNLPDRAWRVSAKLAAKKGLRGKWEAVHVMGDLVARVRELEDHIAYVEWENECHKAFIKCLRSMLTDEQVEEAEDQTDVLCPPCPRGAKRSE